jgi:acyl-CoA thioesterase I
MRQSRRRLLTPAAVLAGVVLLGTSAGAPPEPTRGTPADRAAASVHAAALPYGVPVFNPRSGRLETYNPQIRRSAILIGDSQSAGAAGVPSAGTWPVRALASLGYLPRFVGRGGTGFVAANGSTGNYVDALRHGDWLLPYGNAPLVVIQGGGNDAAIGAGDAAIARNAALLITEVRKSYPDAEIVLVGTLARGASDGGGRRTEVDAVLGRTARASGVRFISAGDWLTRYDAVPLLADGVHLSERGHRLFAAVLADKLAGLGLSLGAETNACC